MRAQPVKGGLRCGHSPRKGGLKNWSTEVAQNKGLLENLFINYLSLVSACQLGLITPELN